jgi:alanyl-tRNA synthetase
MQKHKPRFLDPTHTGILSDIQHCLRLNDLDEIGDGTHLLDFHMLGLLVSGSGQSSKA